MAHEIGFALDELISQLRQYQCCIRLTQNVAQLHQSS